MPEMPEGSISSCLAPDQWPAKDRALAEEFQRLAGPLETKVVVGRSGLVTTTSSPIAAQAGVEALRAGGTAADAVITVALTQAMTALGSYVSYAGIMNVLYYGATSDRFHSLNAGWNSYLHEADPRTIPTCDLFVDPTSCKAPSLAIAHGRKTLVPGFMAGIEGLHRR